MGGLALCWDVLIANLLHVVIIGIDHSLIYERASWPLANPPGNSLSQPVGQRLIWAYQTMLTGIAPGAETTCNMAGSSQLASLGASHHFQFAPGGFSKPGRQTSLI